MAKASRQGKQEAPPLFELPEPTPAEPRLKPLHYRIWTENKAKLIERYLYYFVLITKHGTYIDGFAGPQDPSKPDSWAAKLVLESEPRWLRNFYLFDEKKQQVSRLEVLKRSQPPRDVQRKEPERNIHISKGDFNVLILDLLQTQ